MKILKKLVLAGLFLCMATAGVTTANAADISGTGENGFPLYGIGSVSKMYTTAAVMKLVQQGKIDLDRPLTEYLPDFYMEDDRYREITPRMLLNHRSGLQGSAYTNSMTLGKASRENHDLLLERLRTQRLKADPGSFAVYCNDGFTLAELMVESVTGVDFTEYVKETFAVPLGIENLESPQSLADSSRLATIYLKGGSEIPYESANLIGSGGFYSTAQDICRFFELFTSKSMDGEEPILTRATVEEMAKESYGSDTWNQVSQEGSSMAYGLGWDTVTAYPFAGLGIQALSKGGDTTAYHAAVTVLPQQNLTCAVTVSGGNSMAAGQAVQEILLDYLRMKGKLEEVRGMETGSAQTKDSTKGNSHNMELKVPDAFKRYQGFYSSGKQLMKVTYTDYGKLSLQSIGTKRDVTQTYTYQGDGSFLSDGQDYISLSGSLVAAEGGIYGNTVLGIQTDQTGRPYLVMETKENQPRFGNSLVSLPFAQKLDEQKPDLEVKETWETLAGNRYFLVSEQYNSSMWLGNPSLNLFVSEEIPGYLVVSGGNAEAVLQIKDKKNAVFFQQIPGHGGRDLYDLSVWEKNGKTYLDTQNFRFADSLAMPSSSEIGERIVMGREEESKCYTIAREDRGRQIRITVSGNGHFYIYRSYPDSVSCIASSVTGDGDRNIYLPEDGMIVFAGEDGAVFTVNRQ